MTKARKRAPIVLDLTSRTIAFDPRAIRFGGVWRRSPRDEFHVGIFDMSGKTPTLELELRLSRVQWQEFRNKGNQVMRVIPLRQLRAQSRKENQKKK
jgi:hypothetical protein